MLTKILRLIGRKTWRALKAFPLWLIALPWRIAKTWPWTRQRRKTARFVKRWQTPLSALVGFSGVMATLAYSGYKDRAVKIEEEDRAGRALVVGMFAEAIALEQDLYTIDHHAFTSSRIIRHVMKSAVKPCDGLAYGLGNLSASGLGIFSAGLQNAGRVPVDLLADFAIVISLAQGVKAVGNMRGSLSCDDEPARFVNNLAHFTLLARRQLRVFATKTVLRYPGLEKHEGLIFRAPLYRRPEVRSVKSLEKLREAKRKAK